VIWVVVVLLGIASLVVLFLPQRLSGGWLRFLGLQLACWLGLALALFQAVDLAALQSRVPALVVVVIVAAGLSLTSAVRGLTPGGFARMGCVLLVAVVAAGGILVGVKVDDGQTGTPNVSSASGVDPSDCDQATVIGTRPYNGEIWAALGDSYSAGVGGALNGTQFGQDITNAFSWAGASQLVNERTNQRIGLMMSACSGAVVRNLFHATNEVDRQLTPDDVKNREELTEDDWAALPDALQTLQHATVVTLTVGGNDAGFGNVANGVLSGLGPLIGDGGLANPENDDGDPTLEGLTPQGEWRALRHRLVQAYEVAVKLMRRRARLFVVQYPEPFADSQCPLRLPINDRTKVLLNQFTARLNHTIARAAQVASDRTGREVAVVRWGGGGAWPTDSRTFNKLDRERLKTAEPPDSRRFIDGVPYNPSGLCGDNNWLNGLGLLSDGRNLEDSFHPSTAGSLAESCDIVKKIVNRSAKLRNLGYRPRLSEACRAARFARYR